MAPDFGFLLPDMSMVFDVLSMAFLPFTCGPSMETQGLRSSN